MQEQLALAFRIASINFQRNSIAQVEIYDEQLLHYFLTSIFLPFAVP